MTQSRAPALTQLPLLSQGGRVLVAVSLSLALLSCSGSSEKAEPQIRPVKYATVGASGSSNTRAISGSIIARDATQLSFRVGGTLSTLSVKMGDTVKTGQLIGKLDDSDYAVALSQAQANYQSAKTQRDGAQTTFNRIERLFESGTSSQADYEGARSTVQAAQAQLSAAGQSVKQARNQRQYAALKAPFAGVINSVSARQGESIGAGQPIVVVSRGGELEVSVGVPAGIIASVKIGTKATIEVATLGNTRLSGSVREVGFSSQSSTYPARVALDAPLETLRPGMAASATFDLGIKTAELSVPASAVANSEESSYVFILEKGSNEAYTVKRRQVTLGSLMGETFEIKEGLATGERVATAGLGSLVDGMQVTLLAPAVKDVQTAPAAKDAPTSPSAPKAPTPGASEGAK